MEHTIEIWFPNYKNNPGIVSKELINTINLWIKHFDVRVKEGRFLSYEIFELILEFDNIDYKDYVTNLIQSKLGYFPQVNELDTEMEILGRVFSPGKVGFGIFVDIGIRNNHEQTDALLPLYKLREDLEVDDLSTREIVRILGLVDGYPLPLVIDEVEHTEKPKINVSLAPSFIDQLISWGEDGRERLIVTKTLTSSVKMQLRNLSLTKYIDETTSIDPLTTIIVCGKKTHASGIVPKLGAKLPKVPIGIFHP